MGESRNRKCSIGKIIRNYNGEMKKFEFPQIKLADKIISKKMVEISNE